ncbi:MAG: class I SAM-dependent RNA methyltransferase [Acidobacteriota bacterium]
MDTIIDQTGEGIDLEVGSLHEVTIEKLVYGGDGLAHIGSRALFIPYAAIGDKLLVRITALARNYARGMIDQIIDPSPTRRTPPCSHFGICGGCQFQHLEYSAQLAAKSGFLRESLQRIGQIEWQGEIEVIPSEEFGYRSRAEIKVDRDEDGRVRIGYFRTGTHEVCAIDTCAILLPSANRELQRLHSERSLIPADSTRVFVTAGDEGVIVTPANGSGERAAEFDALGTAHQQIDGIAYGFGIRSFFQSNRYLIEELIHRAIGDASGKIAIDLYAGVGLFSLQLSRRFEQVHAIEGNRSAANHGLDNLKANGLTNVRYEAISVEAWLKYKACAMAQPDFVLLDPPRAGAGHKVIERIAALCAPAISYVSCDPATLARDLRMLIDRGYRLRSIVALDMFPQTFHLEAVARLELITTST